MSVAASQQSFLTNVITPIHKPRSSSCRTSSSSPPSVAFSVTFITCNRSGNQRDHDDPDKDRVVSRRKYENQWAKLAVVTLAAGVLTLGSVDDASAAKTGGRIGGQAFRSSAPRASSPRAGNSSRTNIYINPPVAPPLVGGYGYGYGVPFYGGWGWSPFSFFTPSPGIPVGVGGGFDTLVLFMFLGAAAAVVRRFIGPKDEVYPGREEEYPACASL